jgi:hypothetical protein
VLVVVGGGVVVVDVSVGGGCVWSRVPVVSVRVGGGCGTTVSVAVDDVDVGGAAVLVFELVLLFIGGGS